MTQLSDRMIVLKEDQLPTVSHALTDWPIETDVLVSLMLRGRLSTWSRASASGGYSTVGSSSWARFPRRRYWRPSVQHADGFDLASVGRNHADLDQGPYGLARHAVDVTA